MVSPPSTEKTIPQPYKLTQTLTVRKRSISSVKFADDDILLATSSADNTARTYSTTTFTTVHVFSGHLLGLSDVSFSSDSRHLSTASDDKTVKIGDVFAGQLIKSLTGHTSYVFFCTFNPRSNMIVSGSFDKTARVWDYSIISNLKV